MDELELGDWRAADPDPDTGDRKGELDSLGEWMSDPDTCFECG